MWKRVLSFWVMLQLLLGVALVVVPVYLTGTFSLVVTIPIFVVLSTLTVMHEASQSKRQQTVELIRKFNVLISDFRKLTQGAYSCSVWAILRDLRGDSQFRAQMDKSGNHQAGELLDVRCQRLFTDTGKFAEQVRRLNGTTHEKLREAIKEFGDILIEYRQVVQEFLRFLEDTKGEKETIQHKAPFSVRVHRELADEYDRLMDSIRQMRSELRLFTESDWLPDEHLSRFPRASFYA